jgi:hypothetical protein
MNILFFDRFLRLTTYIGKAPKTRSTKTKRNSMASRPNSKSSRKFKANWQKLREMPVKFANDLAASKASG